MKLTKEIRNYRVEKYQTSGQDSELGILPYEDVKRILKNYKYDELLDMYFSSKANIGYYITEEGTK